MTLAEKMYNEYSPYGSKRIEENRKKALEDIAYLMGKGEMDCVFCVEPSKQEYSEETESDDFLIYRETMDYLKENGFGVSEKKSEFDGCVYAIVSWKHIKEKYNEELS